MNDDFKGWRFDESVGWVKDDRHPGAEEGNGAMMWLMIGLFIAVVVATFAMAGALWNEVPAPTPGPEGAVVKVGDWVWYKDPQAGVFEKETPWRVTKIVADGVVLHDEEHDETLGVPVRAVTR